MKTREREAWWDRVNCTEVPEELSTKEKQELSGLLQRETMVTALAMLRRHVLYLSTNMLRVDLGQPEGVAAATKMQSKAAGIVWTIENLGALCAEEEEEEEEVKGHDQA